jgi:hypothetical protein
VRLEKIDRQERDVLEPFDFRGFPAQIIAKLPVHTNGIILEYKSFQCQGVECTVRLYPENAMGIHTERFGQK